MPDIYDLSPIEKYGDIYCKREDEFKIDKVNGTKARVGWQLATGTKGIVTGGGRNSPQVNIIAHIAKQLNLECRCHVPIGVLGPELIMASKEGAEIIQHKPGYNSVITKRAKDDANERGWGFIPPGVKCNETIQLVSFQVKNIPAQVKRIVIPVGSGMSLAGLLYGLETASIDLPVLGVCVANPPRRVLDKYAPSGWEDKCDLVDAKSYNKSKKNIDLPIALDPFYEKKCLPFIGPYDLFWIVGKGLTV
jgi:1-aminocyclopropane-1-carboxylate deaminase/D-cysteine desulfhydrase-like pyridoxal-dependent ACC family enzyme